MLAIVFFTTVNTRGKNQFRSLWVPSALCSHFSICSSANTVKAVFSSWICILAFVPLYLSSNAEFQAVLRKPSTVPLSSKICRIVLLSPFSAVSFSIPLFFSVVQSSWTQTIHHTACSYVPLFPHIFASRKWKRKARVFVAQWWLYDTSGNVAHTFKAAGQNKAVWTNQVILTWN